MNNFIRTFTEAINSFYGLPAGVMTLIICLIWGLALKSNKTFPNDKIPVRLMWIGAFFYVGLSDWYQSKLAINIWVCKNIAVGMAIGFFAPKIHSKWIKPWESKIPFIGNLLERGNSDPVAFVKDSSEIEYLRSKTGKSLLGAKEPKPLDK